MNLKLQYYCNSTTATLSLEPICIQSINKLLFQMFNHLQFNMLVSNDDNCCILRESVSTRSLATTFFNIKRTYFLALSFKKLCSSNSFWLPISRNRVVNLLCHSLQWPRSANFSGELSKRTKSILRTVSSFWKLLAISVYLKECEMKC